MKAFKFFAMLLAAFTFSFGFVSCGDDDDEDITGGGGNNGIQVTSGISELKDTGSEISYSIWETAANIKTTTTMTYGYSPASGLITSLKITYECNSSKALDALYDELVADGQNPSKSGSKVTCVMNPEDYEDMTVEDVKLAYQIMKDKYDNRNK